jgi:hypothetical protein
MPGIMTPNLPLAGWIGLDLLLDCRFAMNYASALVRSELVGQTGYLLVSRTDLQTALFTTLILSS